MDLDDAIYLLRIYVFNNYTHSHAAANRGENNYRTFDTLHVLAILTSFGFMMSRTSAKRDFECIGVMAVFQLSAKLW